VYNATVNGSRPPQTSNFRFQFFQHKDYLMNRALILALVLGFARSASAHFVFILPEPTSGDVQVVFNDKLGIDERIPSARLASTRLVVVDAQSGRAALEWKAEEKGGLRAALPAMRPSLVGGATTYGYAKSAHTGNKPVLVKYYPKAVLVRPEEAVGLRIGEEARYEIVPETVDGRLRLRVLRGDEPVSGVAFTVLSQDGAPPRRGTVSKEGYVTEAFDRPGRYGVWIKIIEPTPGEWEGRPYEEVHSYATLVFDAPETRP
jgi:hypothetical protein